MYYNTECHHANQCTASTKVCLVLFTLKKEAKVNENYYSHRNILLGRVIDNNLLK